MQNSHRYRHPSQLFTRQQVAASTAQAAWAPRRAPSLRGAAGQRQENKGERLTYSSPFGQGGSGTRRGPAAHELPPLRSRRSAVARLRARRCRGGGRAIAVWAGGGEPGWLDPSTVVGHHGLPTGRTRRPIRLDSVGGGRGRALAQRSAATPFSRTPTGAVTSTSGGWRKRWQWLARARSRRAVRFTPDRECPHSRHVCRAPIGAAATLAVGGIPKRFSQCACGELLVARFSEVIGVTRKFEYEDGFSCGRRHADA